MPMIISEALMRKLGLWVNIGAGGAIIRINRVDNSYKRIGVEITSKKSSDSVRGC